MKEIIVTTQAEFDALPTRFEEYTRIIIKNTTSQIAVRVARENSSVVAWENSSVEARGNSSVVAWGNSSVEAWENSSVVARENSSVEAWGNSSVEAWGNSSVVAWGNSSVEALGNSSVEALGNSSVEAGGNSSVEAWENSSVEAWGNSSVKAWENSSVVAWEDSSVVAWGNSSVVAWGNSSVVAWGNSVVRIFSSYVKKIALYGFAVAILSATLNVRIEKKSNYCHIQTTKNLGWFENNGVDGTETVTLYKRVSVDFKTQEGTENETTWTVGTTLIVPNWNPHKECGPGKFHACSRPFFCDEFREKKDDRYIVISIALTDLHEWTDDPEYPHKIAFRAGTVLYECDRHGRVLKTA